ncbi:helix-turn-helix transcriptional regulator [Caulobacter sp. 602-2]|uniref:Helix-turn-helix transcriptional regulator n=1 Tax=Caulobacter sp. 602-2 TaxID=2710887 RepID=A0A6G4QV13_9CAUL|nr:helix-turn-helix transcriptional regulator [Caulobacter sp. 602-2]NGM49372.1 helix-turn-helix transcriptional regulator [Caulobacter sp. 602-2]
MPKTIFDGAHADLVQVLVEARKRSGLTQTEVAELVGKDQTFISLIERSQRRVDVLEFIVLARAMKQDPATLFGVLLSKVPARIRI